MSALLAGLPQGVPGSTINRLCGSGMDAVGVAARAIKSGEAALMVAGGVESMTRAPFVMGRPRARSRDRHLRYDDRLALRQSADETAARRRFDAGDGRKRRGRLRHQPRTCRAAQPAEGRARTAGRHARRGNRRGHDCAEEGRSAGRVARRASARDVARNAGEAEGRRAPGRLGDGRHASASTTAAALLLANEETAKRSA